MAAMISGQISPLKNPFDDDGIDGILDLTASDTGEPLTILCVDQGINYITNLVRYIIARSLKYRFQ